MNIARRIFIYCILIVAFLLAMSVFTPTWAQQNQPIGLPTNNVYAKGMLSADSALRTAKQFKVYPYFDSTGELAVVGHNFYYHNGLIWVMVPDTASLSGIYFKKIDSNTHKNAITLDYLDTQLARKQDTLSGTGIVESNAGVISYLPDPLPIDNGGTASTSFDAGSVVFMNSGGFQMLGNANLFKRDFSGSGGGWVMNSSFPSVLNVGLTLGSVVGGGAGLGFIDYGNGGPLTHILGPTDTSLIISSGGSNRGIDFQINGAKRIAVSSSGDLVMYGSSSGSLTIKVPSVVATYSVTLPAAQGAANSFLKNDGSGNLLWAGAVSSVGTGFGIVGGTITSTGTIYVDSTVLPIWKDTLSTRRRFVTPSYLNSLGFLTSAVTSVTGTSGKIDVAGTFTPTVTISPAYIGQTSITTLGTIITGIWHGSKLGLLYGGTNTDLSGTGGTSNVLMQTSVGAAVTVGQLATTDLSDVESNISFAPSPTGFATTTVSVGNYWRTGDVVYYLVRISGTSNATTFTFTLPYAARTGNNVNHVLTTFTNNGVSSTVFGKIIYTSGSTTATLFTTAANGTWTASNGKEAFIEEWYFK